LFDPNSQTSADGTATSSDSSTSAAANNGGLTDLRQQIDAAIAAALQTYQTGDSAATGGATASTGSGSPSATNSPGTPDILQAISNAITQTLQKNGLDPRQLQQQARAGHHHHHHHAEASSGTNPASSSDPGSPTDPASPASGLGMGNQQGLNLLAQLVQTNGANSLRDQLASDLLAEGNSSLQNPGVGSLAQLLSNLPAGSNVNTQA
jgi:hypothetical protein